MQVQASDLMCLWCCVLSIVAGRNLMLARQWLTLPAV